MLISLRWRGSFNGGSDFMTLIVLMGLGLASLFPNHLLMGVGCLWYIALQTCTSYFISGLVKLKRANWRQGKALTGFIRLSIYEPGPFVKWFLESPKISLRISWVLILFECSFPLALLRFDLALAYVSFGFLFHLANFYIFGLNRFLFAWLATYPALLFAAVHAV